MGNDFDSMNFENDEQLEAVLDTICEAIEKDEQKTTMLSTIRFEQMKFCHAVLRYLIQGKSGLKLTYELNKPFKTMGYISLEGEVLEFTKAEWFARAAEFASNMEVYPLAKNKVRLTFTFHGLTTPIE